MAERRLPIASETLTGCFRPVAAVRFKFKRGGSGRSFRRFWLHRAKNMSFLSIPNSWGGSLPMGSSSLLSGGEKNRPQQLRPA